MNSQSIQINNDADYHAALEAISRFQTQKLSNEIAESRSYQSTTTYVEKFLAIENTISVSETTIDGTIISVNDCFIKLSGYSRSELIGNSHRLLKSGVHPKSFYEKMKKCLWDGKEWSGEVCDRAKNGTIFWVHSVIFPVIDFETKEIKSYLCIMHDITERKRIENLQAKSQYQLIQLQKMDSIGKMTSGIAHDFNNIVTVILGFSRVGLVFCHKQNFEKLLPCLEQIQIASNRAADLVNKMLMFCSENITKAIKPIDPSEIVEEVAKISHMLRAGISTEVSITLVNSLNDKSASILIDPTELHQILTNLMVNAYDAIDASNRQNSIISISVFSDFVEENLFCTSCGKKIEGDFITISVSDTGMGISPQELDDIFDPFFTTKEIGNGTGLGLSVVSGIVHNEDGHIVVESVLDAGTTFYLLFPAVYKNASDGDDDKANSNLELNETYPQSKFKICVVDDEEGICLLLDEDLTNLGHDVKTFSDSLKAKAFFNENPDYFDVIITDYTMPNLTGLDLANFMLSIRPELPILICTGYSGKLKSSDDLPKGNTFLIKKPLDIQIINETIKKISNTKKFKN